MRTRELFQLVRSSAWAKTNWVAPDPDVWEREPGLSEVSAQAFMTLLTGTSPVVKVAIDGTNVPLVEGVIIDANWVEINNVSFTADGNQWLGASKVVVIKDYAFLRTRVTVTSGTVLTGSVDVYMQGDRVI